MKKMSAVLTAFLMLGSLFMFAACGGQTGETTGQASSVSQGEQGTGPGGENAAARAAWPVVQTAYGPVRGVQENGVTAFKGVPFAAPPVGELRFAPPQQPAAWTQTLPCDTYKDAPVQAGEVEDVGMSEDCLYLNIWAPEDAVGKDLPVLVFIHGGAYATGYASKPLYDGTRFAQDGVIQVNVAYRLNAMGFLPTQAALEEYGTPGNVGTMDQIFALEWVQENIEAFGGDADNVTICGESAGAFSVSNMMLSPMAEGLFARAILESGNTLGQPLVAPDANGDMQQGIARGDALAEELEAVDEQGNADLATLRQLPAEELAEASEFNLDLTDPSEFYLFTVFDGMVLPEDPYEALERGEINDVPILVGYNTDEGSLFVPNNIRQSTYTEFVENIFGPQDAEAVLERFPVDRENTATDRARYLIKMGLRFGNDAFADVLSQRGQDVYYYNFDYSVPQLDDVGLGTMHAMELPFVFDTMPEGVQLDAAGEAFKEDLHGRWLQFIRNGDPNGGENQQGDDWPLYSAENPEMLVLNEEPAVRPVPDTEDAAFFCELFWGDAPS